MHHSLTSYKCTQIIKKSYILKLKVRFQCETFHNLDEVNVMSDTFYTIIYYSYYI